ncbi:MAG: transcriptional regulator [Candidatus Korobacteraceae bacterium]|jgi:DNA-binding winged helix-turn-helix (wHTH) protein
MTKIKYFRFGAFRLYPTEHLLLREEAAVPLAPKAFDILLYLVQNSGHLVKRDVLMEAIWPDSFVEETNLTVNISLLRKALETGDQPYIETIPRKGYRFTAEVTECEEDGEKYQKSNEDVTSPSVGDPAGGRGCRGFCHCAGCGCARSFRDAGAVEDVSQQNSRHHHRADRVGDRTVLSGLALEVARAHGERGGAVDCGAALPAAGH